MIFRNSRAQSAWQKQSAEVGSLPNAERALIGSQTEEVGTTQRTHSICYHACERGDRELVTRTWAPRVVQKQAADLIQFGGRIWRRKADTRKPVVLSSPSDSALITKSISELEYYPLTFVGLCAGLNVFQTTPLNGQRQWTKRHHIQLSREHDDSSTAIFWWLEKDLVQCLGAI